MFASQKRKHQVSLKAALRRMRGLWLSGEQSRFDDKLARILNCSVEKAEEIREEWLSLGFLGYDCRGLLTWRAGGI
ncbi:hypothetical protein ES707_20573 [subsurface metagenome]